MSVATATTTSRPSSSSAGFHFTHRDTELSGIIERPQTPNGTLIMLVHGWGTCRTGPQRYFVRLSELLAEGGFTVARCDLPGRGASDGDPATVTIDDMGEAAAACIDYLQGAEPGIREVGLCGICSGGNAAILAALKRPVNRMVLWSTFTFDAEKALADKSRRTGHFIGVYLRKLTSVATWKKLFCGALNLKLVWRTLFGHYKAGGPNLKQTRVPVMAKLKDYKGELLFIYGSNDPEAVTPRTIYKDYCAANGLKAQFIDIEGASHNFFREEWGTELLRKTVEFFKEALASENYSEERDG